ncbi:MAG: patatin-like phospholipase family protein [Thiolinea sp.]
MTQKHKSRIGIALGGGAARGWAHIGILQQLADMGIHPEIVSGCSIGSLVGAAYVADNLNQLQKWTLSLTKIEMMRYFEFNTTFNGFVRQERLRQLFHDQVCARNQSIEGLKKSFASVATNLHNGREVWFTEGPVIDAVWASIALPGLFQPVSYEEQWLIDGGLVNPVPVSLCRAMGADTVIAVNLNHNLLRTKNRKKSPAPAPEPTQKQEEQQPSSTSPSGIISSQLVNSVASSLREYSSNLFPDKKDNNQMPGVIETLAGSIYIMQDKITRSRMVGDPPELLLNPRLSDIGLLEFYRAEEAIEEGRQSVIRMQAEIEHIIDLSMPR